MKLKKEDQGTVKLSGKRRPYSFANVLNTCNRLPKRDGDSDISVSRSAATNNGGDFEGMWHFLPMSPTVKLYRFVDSCDVVVQVLDARDPLATRCYRVEKYLKENCKDKHMILLLNKCDLVPAWVAKGWLKVLSKEYPTLAFRATSSDTNSDTDTNTNTFGKDYLMSVLSQFARLKSDNQAISVGIIGYQNVGKSSVISALRRNNVYKKAPIPGESNVSVNVWEYIKLAERICYQEDSTDDSETPLVLKDVVHIKNLQEAAQHVGQVLNGVKKESIERVYRIKHWDDVNDFLHQMSKSAFHVMKDLESTICGIQGVEYRCKDDSIYKNIDFMIAAAKTVLDNFKTGRICFFVPPPKLDDDDAVEEHKEFSSIEADKAVDEDEDQVMTARKAIADIVSSQLKEYIDMSYLLY